MNFTVIGISDSREQRFAPQIVEAIGKARVFSGGKRHHEIVSHLLPEGAVWIDITIPLSRVFEMYKEHQDIVVFASGDPLFYGFAATLQREMPDAKMVVFPSFNSLQLLAHRMCLPYHDMTMVSLTGRPWDKLDEALIRGCQLIGCLTDREHTPHTIMQRMLDYGYDNYVMTVGECLGNDEKERVSEYRADAEYAMPNCVMLQKKGEGRKRLFGIPETDFALLDGRAKMITKMPIRLLSLSMLDLAHRHSMWDVGFCTGSVCIEAKLQFPHLHINAFEVREQGRELMRENSRRFGTPGINTVIADFTTLDLTQYERPDAVFIGGHGGKLKQMVSMIRSVLLPGGCIVFNSVSEESRQLFTEAIEAVGMKLTQSTRIAVDEHNPIYIMKAE